VLDSRISQSLPRHGDSTRRRGLSPVRKSHYAGVKQFAFSSSFRVFSVRIKAKRHPSTIHRVSQEVIRICANRVN
jgi:hypothetical protein